MYKERKINLLWRCGTQAIPDAPVRIYGNTFFPPLSPSLSPSLPPHLDKQGEVFDSVLVGVSQIDRHLVVTGRRREGGKEG